MQRKRALTEKWTDLAQHFVDNAVRNGLKLLGPSRTQIDGARLITAHDTGGPHAGARERDRKACRSGRTASGRDRQHDRNTGQVVELARRYHQNGSVALLLVAGGRIERDQIDVATLQSPLARCDEIGERDIGGALRAG
jgi:hypothetical protein